MGDQTTTANGLIEIAVLDDDLDFRNYIEDFLRDEGNYAVRTFAHPEDLFAAAEQRVPDVVLLDMKMGEFTGDKVVEQLLSRWPELCIIVVTGYPSLEDMRATFKLRVFDYLAKPFSLAQLRQTLQNAIEKFNLGRTPQDRLRERLGRYTTGRDSRAARASHQTHESGTRLVAQRSRRGNSLERFANQLHRARREFAERRKPAGPLPRLRPQAV